jgi:4-oxalomesaconate tautomerase
MPVVVMAADQLGATGYESCAELEDDANLRAKLEAIRLEAGPLMRLGDVAATTVPKLTLVAAPKSGGSISTRTFIPHRCHEAIGVLGAVSVATACLLPGSTAHRLTDHRSGSPIVTLEHPSGTFDASVEVVDGEVRRAGIVRTARKLMDGVVFPRVG